MPSVISKQWTNGPTIAMKCAVASEGCVEMAILSKQELNTENLKNIHFLKGITSLNLSHNVIDEITEHVFDGLSQVSMSK